VTEPHRPTDPQRADDERRAHREGWLLLGAIFAGLALLVVVGAMV
jgi:hypothetical protein